MMEILKYCGRMNEIINHLKCRFFRYNEKENNLYEVVLDDNEEYI